MKITTAYGAEHNCHADGCALHNRTTRPRLTRSRQSGAKVRLIIVRRGTTDGALPGRYTDVADVLLTANTVDDKSGYFRSAGFFGTFRT
jgi:hypothetical protein